MVSHYNILHLRLYDCIYSGTPLVPEKWPLKRGGLLSGVETNTIMYRFTLSSSLSRGGGLSSGWPLKRGSTICRCHVCDPNGRAIM